MKRKAQGVCMFNFSKIALLTFSLIIATISNFSTAGTADELQKAINQTGGRCLKVTQHFINGKEKNGTTHVSVACSGGENYLVAISAKGDEAKVLPCSFVDKLSGGRGQKGSCFTKY